MELNRQTKATLNILNFTSENPPDYWWISSKAEYIRGFEDVKKGVEYSYDETNTTYLRGRMFAFCYNGKLKTLNAERAYYEAWKKFYII